MYPRLEGEVAKLIRVENGWNVVIWDPEAPKTAIPGQAPCAQQPVKWWKTWSFPTLGEAVGFMETVVPELSGV